jgi:heat shock protein HslJ
MLVSVGGVPARPAAQGPYILFRPGEGGRRLGGVTGCNGLKGSYDVFAGRLRIVATALTGRPCTTALASQETKLVEALRETANYRIAGNELALLTTDGRVLARFTARPGP